MLSADAERQILLQDRLCGSDTIYIVTAGRNVVLEAFPERTLLESFLIKNFKGQKFALLFYLNFKCGYNASLPRGASELVSRV